jgi:hypothetical protein
MIVRAFFYFTKDCKDKAKVSESYLMRGFS